VVSADNSIQIPAVFGESELWLLLKSHGVPNSLDEHQLNSKKLYHVSWDQPAKSVSLYDQL